MNYCTIDDIKNQISEKTLIELSNDDYSQELIIAEVVDSAIESASELIDGYVRGSYPLPLPTAPTILKNIAVELAVYQLTKRRLGENMPESRENAYKNSISQLKDIQKGIIDLGLQNQESAPQRTMIFTNKTSKDRVFGRNCQ